MSTDPSSQLSPSSSSVELVLSRGFFEIPTNQRTYKWSNDEREKLWNDICMTIKDGHDAQRNHSIGHFLGTVVVVGKEVSHNAARLKIIDGQQRLTTLTILIDCLSHFVDSMNARNRRRYDGPLTGCISSGTEAYQRLKLNRENLFFKGSLLECVTREEKESYWERTYNEKSIVQKNIVDAYRFFYKNIEKHIEANASDYDDVVAELVDTILNRFYFLLVRTENTWMTYKLFETLNDRGLELSKADLIRNVLLESAADSGQNVVDDVDSAWNEIIDNSEEQDKPKLELSQIIQFSYTYRNSLVKKEDIFEKVSGDLRTADRDALELAVEFEVDSENWCAFQVGDMSKWSNDLIDTHYAILKPLWKSHCVPYVMGVMDKYTDDVDNLKLLLSLCESYLFRQGLICRDSVANIQEFFGNVAKLVRLGSDIDSIVKSFKKASPDELFIDAFKTARLSNMQQGYYTIWKIENYLMTEIDFRPRTQGQAQHLEHIMPKKPSDAWGDIQKEDGFNTHLNMIGNLLLLQSGVNRHIQNREIQYKLKNDKGLDYINSELNLTSEFVGNFDAWAQNKEWGFDSIRKRQEYLANNYAKNVWSLDVL